LNRFIPQKQLKKGLENDYRRIKKVKKEYKKVLS